MFSPGSFTVSGLPLRPLLHFEFCERSGFILCLWITSVPKTVTEETIFSPEKALHPMQRPPQPAGLTASQVVWENGDHCGLHQAPGVHRSLPFTAVHCISMEDASFPGDSLYGNSIGTCAHLEVYFIRCPYLKLVFVSLTFLLHLWQTVSSLDMVE